MNDLTTRLQEGASDLCSPGGCCYGDVMVEAADEIKRLRVALLLFGSLATQHELKIKELRAAGWADVLDDEDDIIVRYKDCRRARDALEQKARGEHAD